MSSIEEAFRVLTGAGGVGLIGVLAKLLFDNRKLRADARKVNSDVDVAEVAAEDAHTTALLQQQMEFFITPLRNQQVEMQGQIDAQGEKIRHLEARVDTLSRKYRSALDHIRLLMARLRHHSIDPDPAPVDIAADL